MLLNLIRYEFKATALRFLQLFAIGISVSVLTAILISSNIRVDNNYGVVPAVISFVVGIWIFVIISIPLLALIMVVHRFYHSMVGKGAYFTYCIPASAEHLVLSKLIVSVIWHIVSAILLFFGIFIVGISTISAMKGFNVDLFDRLKETYIMIQDHPEGKQYLELINELIGVYIIFNIVSIFYGIISWYFAAAVGMQFHKHKVGFMILTIVGISVFMNVLSSLVISGDLFRFSFDSVKFGGKDILGFYREFVDTQKMWIMKVTFISVILSIAGFFGTVHLIKKSPNVN